MVQSKTSFSHGEEKTGICPWADVICITIHYHQRYDLWRTGGGENVPFAF